MIRTALRIVTLVAATAVVVAMAAGCSPGTTTARAHISTKTPAPQRALRIYPVGVLIADVTTRDETSIDSRVGTTRMARREEEGVQEAR